MIREKKLLIPTLKVRADPDNENDVPFTEMQVSLKEIADIDTIHGVRTKALVMKDDITYSVFVNPTSINNIIDAFGENDEVWIGKLFDLKLEVSKHFKTDMIVFHPVKA